MKFLTTKKASPMDAVSYNYAIENGLHVAPFTEADVVAIADDDVVENGDFHNLAGFHHVLCHVQIFLARFRIAARIYCVNTNNILYNTIFT